MSTEGSAQFQCNGWSVLPRFLDQHEAEAIAAEVPALLSAPRPSCMSRPGNDLIPLRWNDGIVRSALGSVARVERLQQLLNARDLKWLSGYMSTKAPNSRALWWHQDWWCWDHPISFSRTTAQVAVLCYLTESGESNGALRVLSGSHHKSFPIHGQLPEPHGDAANTLSTDHPAMADLPTQTTVSVKAGDAVVSDYRLLHGTHANRSHLRRDCLLLSFLLDWRGLPPEIKAHLIMHPALPSESELATVPGNFADLMPRHGSAPRSMPVNRSAPRHFAAH